MSKQIRYAIAARTAAIVYEPGSRVAVNIKEALKRSRTSITRGSDYERTEASRYPNKKEQCS